MSDAIPIRVLETQKPIVPIMMTTNRRNALDDCLLYTVEHTETIGAD